VALTRIRNGRPASSGPRRRSRHQPAPRADAEALTVGALYDIALHGAQLQTLNLHGTNGRGLTAAAVNVQSRNAQDIRRLIQPWQARSMSYYDLVPEVKFAAQFYSQMLRKVRLFPAIRDPKTQEPEELTSGPALAAFDRIRDRTGGRAELQGSYGKLRFLIGECYLTVSPDEDRDEVWEALSPNELRVQPGGIASRFRAPMLSADQYLIGNDKAQGGEGPQFSDAGPDIINVYRLWRPSPAYSWLADCSMQAAIDILEELVLSTYSVRAELKSRLNRGGILWVPDEISFTSLGNDPEEDPTSDEFQERLTSAFTAAMSNPGTAAAFSPIVSRVAAEFIEKIKWMKFNDNAGDLAEISQRAEMVERYGVGVELPPELFKSQTDLNHWTGWLVDKQTWDSYGHPAALEMASDFNAAYLQPTLQEEGFADWAQIVVGIDPAEVINHPNRSKDALDLFDRLLINGEVAREQLGYNANDEMSQAEKDEQAGLKIKDGSLYRYGIPSVRANIEEEPGEVEGPTPTAAPGETTDAATGGKNPPGAPAPKASPPASKHVPNAGPDATNAGPAVTASAAVDAREARILAYADAAIHRAREVAGSRLRAMTSPRGPKDSRCEDCQRLIGGIPNWDVSATLGAEQVKELTKGQATDWSLCDGAGRSFAALLDQMGISAGWATELGDLVEQHAARTLYQATPDPLPAGFASLLRRIDLPLERT
jgi:hypothetical protein